MSDMIDRQAAIDTLEEGFKDVTKGVEKLSPTYGLIEAVTGIYKCLIGKLPSAQPDIVWCKDCKHYQYADNRAFGFPVRRCEWTGFEDVDEDDFCSRAERREVTT